MKFTFTLKKCVPWQYAVQARERERPTNRPDEVGSAYVVYMPLGGRDGEGREEYGDGRRAGKEGD